MKVWVMQGVHEGELYSSVHMTEKGAALAAIVDVLEFLGVDCAVTALSVMNLEYKYTETDGEQTEPIEWDYDKLKAMSRQELWRIFREWSQYTWDNHCGYNVEVMHRELQG